MAPPQILELWDDARVQSLPSDLREAVQHEEPQRFENLVKLVEGIAAKVPDKQVAQDKPHVFTEAAEQMAHIELCAALTPLTQLPESALLCALAGTVLSD